MRWLVLALCGCNQILGVHGELARSDARQFDAPVDAQPYCPPFGVIPTFSPIAHELVDEPCFSYTASASAGIALARCRPPNSSVPAYFQGPLDSALTEPVTGIDIGDIDHSVENLRIFPDGNNATVESFDLNTVVTTIETFTRTGTTTWVRGPDIASSVLAGVSTPTHGPELHMLLYDRQVTGVREIVSTGATWTTLRTIGTSLPPLDAWLSPDGLRAFVLVGQGATLHWIYLDRAAIDTDFVVHEPFTSLPPVQVFITEDCTRAYMSSVEALFYAPQI